MRANILIGILAVLGAFACTYNPPPEVGLEGAESGMYTEGESIVLTFTEKVRRDSLAVRIWPGQKDLYDIEGEFKPSVEPLVDTCTVTMGGCGEDDGVKLTIDADQKKATLTVEARKLGILGVPLVLEVSGELADSSGHKKGVSWFFDFQITEDWTPIQTDIVEDTSGDVEADVPVEPLGVVAGPHLFFATFTSPMKLSQQYFCDLQVNQETGTAYFLMIDSDPIEGAPLNTANPDELVIDHGDEGFLFTVRCHIQRDPAKGLVFECDPITLAQTIGPITFELREMAMYGTITIDEDSSLSRWDGTMNVAEIYYEVGGNETTYPAEQANFQVFELVPDDVPEDNPVLCDTDPCAAVGGQCDLIQDPWPPKDVCP
jgi:hypothetical protein